MLLLLKIRCWPLWCIRTMMMMMMHLLVYRLNRFKTIMVNKGFNVTQSSHIWWIFNICSLNQCTFQIAELFMLRFQLKILKFVLTWLQIWHVFALVKNFAWIKSADWWIQSSCIQLFVIICVYVCKLSGVHYQITHTFSVYVCVRVCFPGITFHSLRLCDWL